jgi:hypothetical protein
LIIEQPNSALHICPHSGIFLSRIRFFSFLNHLTQNIS